MSGFNREIVEDLLNFEMVEDCRSDGTVCFCIGRLLTQEERAAFMEYLAERFLVEVEV